MESFLMKSLVEWSKYFYVLFPKGCWMSWMVGGGEEGKAREQGFKF